jgi:vancomycin resistance protein VanJ
MARRRHPGGRDTVRRMAEPEVVPPLVGTTGRGSRHVILLAVAAVPALVVFATIVELLLGLQVGPIAFFAAFEQWFFLGLLVLVPVALLRDARALRITLVIALVAGIVRFGGEWVSLAPAAAAGPSLHVMAWNIQYDGGTPELDASILASTDADLVAVEELTVAKARVIGRDPAVLARFPYVALFPHDQFDGVGLLSDRPIAAVSEFQSPLGLEAVVDTTAGPVTVIVAHPAHSPIDSPDPFTLIAGYDVTARDADLAALRSRIEAAIGRGERVMLLGDMNTTPTEPGFAALTRGLHDAHAEVGKGPGWTWRPQALVPFGLGIIRIDVVVTSPDVVPVESHEVCLAASDHCQLWATLALT